MVVSLLMYAACLTALVLLFQYFASGEQCGLQKFFISFCLIFTVSEPCCLSCLLSCVRPLLDAVVTRPCRRVAVAAWFSLEVSHVWLSACLCSSPSRCWRSPAGWSTALCCRRPWCRSTCVRSTPAAVAVAPPHFPIVVLPADYLTFSALSSDPSSCNSASSHETFQLVVGLILSAASITYAGAFPRLSHSLSTGSAHASLVRCAGWNIAKNTNSLFGSAEQEQLNRRSSTHHPLSSSLGVLIHCWWLSGDENDAASRTEEGTAGEEEKVLPAFSIAHQTGVLMTSCGAARSQPKKAKQDSAPVDPTVEEAAQVAADELNAKKNARFHFVMAAAAMYMVLPTALLTPRSASLSFCLCPECRASCALL